MVISAAMGYPSRRWSAADSLLFEPPRAPAWARPDGSWRQHSEAEALYFAGASLSVLDSVARWDWARARESRLAA
jgi:hypothetical protein